MRQTLSNAAYVKYGYGQVEPNHLSAQVTGEIYAQLPAAADIDVLENGQFAKYDYENGEVNFIGDGEWLLVYNEVKVYNDHMMDCDFAMIKDNYVARLYSPGGVETNADVLKNKNSRYYGNTYYGEDLSATPPVAKADGTKAADVTKADPYVIDSTENPFVIAKYMATPMKTGTKMVPRLFATHVGDIFTTNTIKDATVDLGNKLTVGADGYLAVASAPAATDMVWKVVKVYTMPDGQPGVKLMRIQ